MHNNIYAYTYVTVGREKEGKKKNDVRMMYQLFNNFRIRALFM